jgi:hypothetical protein
LGSTQISIAGKAQYLITGAIAFSPSFRQWIEIYSPFWFLDIDHRRIPTEPHGHPHRG